MAFPARYTAEIAQRILAELRRGRALRDVCGDAGMPSARTVHKWVNDDH
jgi:terminase small subunit-like protein